MRSRPARTSAPRVGAFYDRIGVGYANLRQPDTRIAAAIDAALGSCERVINVGAGTGSYESRHRQLIAVEPSMAMIRQRAPGSAPAVQAAAERLPFRDRSFDAALAILTVHHWAQRERGLAELRRVARGRVVIFTWDAEHPGFWLVQQYFPEILERDRRAFPSLREIEAVIGPAAVSAVPIPGNCADGFLGAYWQRPEHYLSASVRAAISAFAKFDASAGLERLRSDLADGSWHANNGGLSEVEELDVGYRLVVAECAGARSSEPP
jgi:ubiquinone/menaquinone biosynthesis C-methylase UbiE